ncbi:MAG: Holliday junction branch migration protein RuvA [Planctomycetota bacterium]
MLDYIRGTLTAADRPGDEVVIDHGGLGFRVSVSARTMDALPPVGGPLTMFVEFVPGEREFRLFGFLSATERSLFRLICAEVKNVGPVTAIKVMGAGTVGRMKQAILEGETGFFSQIKGVGPKTSERLVHDLRDRAAALADEPGAPAAPAAGGVRADAVKTLVTLGFTEAAAFERVAQVLKAGGSPDLEEIVKRALQARA